MLIPWMYLWSINDSLSQFLHIPVGHWLRVGQPRSKYLQDNAVGEEKGDHIMHSITVII